MQMEVTMKRKKCFLLLCACMAFSAIFSNGMEAVYAQNDVDAKALRDDEGTYVYDMNDSIITTTTGVKRTPASVSGMYTRDKYPIPQQNQVPNQETYDLIKAENKTLMDNVESAIANGTLSKHIAADGQFFGDIADDVTGVEKTAYLNTNAKGSHSLGVYVPAGEVATITLSDEALVYAKKGKLKISVGLTSDAERYDLNNNTDNRMPYLGKTFAVNTKEVKVGTPFGGMIYAEIDDSIPSGMSLQMDITGVVDTPYYDLGRSTLEEWEIGRSAPGLYVEIRTPYLRFMAPSKYIRNLKDPYDICLYWTDSVALSATTMGQEAHNKPMTLVFDPYIPAGLAVAFVGAWQCYLPTSWITNVLSYDDVIKNGDWGFLHEVNHHYQNYNDKGGWGVGENGNGEVGEITNNTMNTIEYILFSNIAASRSKEGLNDWNKVVDPYSSLKQQIYEGPAYYFPDNKPNYGNFMYSSFAHEVGAINLASVINSTFVGGELNGNVLEPYDYQLERTLGYQGRYDDLAFRLCVAGERDYTWYIINELRWPLQEATINKIKALNYEPHIPVQSVYAMGELGRETGRPFSIPAKGYNFDFDSYTIAPSKAEVKVIHVEQPTFGTLTQRDDGTYDYALDAAHMNEAYDNFNITVSVKADGIEQQTVLNCKVALTYTGSTFQKYAITKWDIHEALEELKTAEPYGEGSSTGMHITSDDGNNLIKADGFFTVRESGTYEFQAYGDDSAVFELRQSDGTIQQSLTTTYLPDVNQAYDHANSTHFIVDLEVGKTYSYSLICNNNDGAGWGDVGIRNVSQPNAWKMIEDVYYDETFIGIGNAQRFERRGPVYVRPHLLAASSQTTIKDVKVLQTPKGVTPNDDPNSWNESDPNSIVDDDISTYFHSSYTNDKTPFPHTYVFDLGEDQSFDRIALYTRRTGDNVGVIGNYEIYTSDLYEADKTQWKKIAEDDTRYQNANVKNDITIDIPDTASRYVMVKALNNRDNYQLTILAEAVFSKKINNQQLIANNSKFISYTGDWYKDTHGAYVNGGTYNTTNGSFSYYVSGTQTMIYAVKETEVEIRTNQGEWKTYKLKGALSAPSCTLKLEGDEVSQIEVRSKSGEIALQMLTTDGAFH